MTATPTAPTRGLDGQRRPSPTSTRSRAVYRWHIVTPGPIMAIGGTTAQARAYVEKYAPPKRGWTGTWEQYAEYPHRHYYVRRNSKGAIVKGYGILLTRNAGDVGRVGG